MHPFRRAIEAHDPAAALLADDVVLTSPVAYQPYPGKAITAAFIRGAMAVFEDFRYVREIADGPDHAFVFRATVAGRQVHGCDFVHVNDEGLIDDLTVMVRPLSGAIALAGAMGARFEQIRGEASG